MPNVEKHVTDAMARENMHPMPNTGKMRVTQVEATIG